MEYNVESLLMLLSDTENLEHEDELSEFIQGELNGELFENELEGVFAAKKNSYDDLVKHLDIMVRSDV